MKTETRKTWRDLPPGPPVGDVPPAPPRPAPPAEPVLPAPEDGGGGRRWSVILVPLLLLAIAATAVGAFWLFGGDDDTVSLEEPGLLEDEPAVPADEAPPLDDPAPDADPFGGGELDELLPPDFLDRFGRNFFDEFGPDLQIPDELLEQFPEFFFEDFGRDFFGDGAPGSGLAPDGLPEDFSRLFPPGLLDELDRFFSDGGGFSFDFGEDFGGDFGGEFAPDFGELFEALPPDLQAELPGDLDERFRELFRSGVVVGGVEAAYLPDGFAVRSASLRSQDGTDGRSFQAELHLTGPDGPIHVLVVGGEPGATAFEGAAGDRVRVAGVGGKEDVRDGTRTITYRKDDTTVITAAPEGFDRAELLRVAAGIQVDR